MRKSSKQKAAPKAAVKKAVRPNVISFRMTDEQYDKLQVLCKKKPVMGVKSPRQYARKIVVDYIFDRLYYANAKDQLADRDMFPTA